VERVQKVLAGGGVGPSQGPLVVGLAALLDTACSNSVSSVCAGSVCIASAPPKKVGSFELLSGAAACAVLARHSSIATLHRTMLSMATAAALHARLLR
jgi:hypothetical protein